MTLQAAPVGASPERMRIILNEVLRGRNNAVGTVTLTASAATTTVTNNLMAPDMGVWFVPTTANASAEIGAGTMYLSTRDTGSFVITHANNAQTDRTFVYVVLG